jgi:hypothetical protein
VAQIQKSETNKQKAGMTQEVEFGIATLLAEGKTSGGAVYRQYSHQ